MVEPPDELINKPSIGSSPPTGEGIVIDIGTGDGLFVYQCARENPNKFYIGIDANPRPLEKVSERIHRSPSKGGVPNVLFLQAAIENLPSELDGIADEVHVHFPWGSLLRIVVTGDPTGLRNLRRICAPGAVLEVLIGLDPDRDRSEIERLGLDLVSIDQINQTLIPFYQAAGFEVMETGVLPQSKWPKLQSSWSKRLRGNDNRELIYIVARVTR